MVIESTIFEGRHSTWRVVVSPNGIDQNGQQSQELIKAWTPKNSSSVQRIYFNPKISIIGMSKTAKHRIWVPISLLYTLRDCIQTSYARLSIKGLFHEQDGYIYCDQSRALEQRIKLPIPKGHSVIFEPSVYYRDEDAEICISITTASSPEGSVVLLRNEAKELFTILDHIDTNSYTVILVLLENMKTLDNKADMMLAKQDQIIRMLAKSIGTKAIENIEAGTYINDFTPDEDKPW